MSRPNVRFDGARRDIFVFIVGSFGLEFSNNDLRDRYGKQL